MNSLYGLIAGAALVFLSYWLYDRFIWLPRFNRKCERDLRQLMGDKKFEELFPDGYK